MKHFMIAMMMIASSLLARNPASAQRPDGGNDYDDDDDHDDDDNDGALPQRLLFTVNTPHQSKHRPLVEPNMGIYPSQQRHYHGHASAHHQYHHRLHSASSSSKCVGAPPAAVSPECSCRGHKSNGTGYLVRGYGIPRGVRPEVYMKSSLGNHIFMYASAFGVARTNNLKLWHRPWQLPGPNIFEVFMIPQKTISEAPLPDAFHLQEGRNQALRFEPACLDLQQQPQHDAAAAAAVAAAAAARGGGGGTSTSTMMQMASLEAIVREEDDDEQEQRRRRRHHHHHNDGVLDDDDDDDKEPQAAELQGQDVYLMAGFRQSFRYFLGPSVEEPLRRTLQFRNASLRDYARRAVDSLRTTPAAAAGASTASASSSSSTTTTTTTTTMTTEKAAFVVGVHVRYGMSTSQDFNGCLPPRTYYNQAMDHYRLQAARGGRRAVFLVAAGRRQEGGESWFSRNVLAQDRCHGHDTAFMSRFTDDAVETLAVLAECDAAVFSFGSYGWWAAWLAGGPVTFWSELLELSHLHQPQSEHDKRCSVVTGSGVGTRDHIPPAWTAVSGWLGAQEEKQVQCGVLAVGHDLHHHAHRAWQAAAAAAAATAAATTTAFAAHVVSDASSAERRGHSPSGHSPSKADEEAAEALASLGEAGWETARSFAARQALNARQFYRFFDEDGAGSVSDAEFAKALSRLDMFRDEPSIHSVELATVVAAMMSAAGIDEKGDVPFSNFIVHFKLADAARR